MKKKYAIAIDRGATEIKAAIGNKERLIGELLIVPTEKYSSVESLVDLVRTVISESGVSLPEIAGIGIGAAGIVNPEKKEITFTPNTSPVSFDLLEKELGIPVFLENDCIAAVIAEKNYGDGKNVQNLVYITISTGIGAGIYYQGRVLKSLAGRRAGEIGFLVIDSDGKCETAGKKGVWEAYCSGKNLPKLVKMWLTKEKRETKLKEIPDLKAKNLFKLAREKDWVAREYVEKIGKLNAIGFANVINAFAPELITVGGSVILNNPELLELIKQKVGDFTVNPVPEIKITRLKEKIVLYGALALVFS